MDDQAPTRRDFLVRAAQTGLGLAGLLLPSCIGGLPMEGLPSRITGEQRGQLPTTTDIEQKNLTYLLLDLELTYGRNGAIPFTREPQTRNLCVSRFEHIADLFGRMTRLGWMEHQPDRFSELDGPTTIAILEILDEAMRAGGLDRPPREEGNSVDFLTPGLLHGSVDCDIYSFIALGVAERYGIPLFGVASPHHFFTRWQSPSVRLNFDQGRIREADDQYIDGSFTNPPERNIPQESLAQGTYLLSLTKRETVATHLGAIATGLNNNREYERALELTALATMWAPQIVAGHYQRAMALRSVGHYDLAFREYQRCAELDPTGYPVQAFHIGL